MAVPVQVRERVEFHRDIHRTLIRGLLQQRSMGEFCDVTLRLHGRKFFAHKAVLAAASPYFRSMFTSPMREQNSSEVDITQSFMIDNTESFQQILDFIYSGDIEITTDNAEDMLRIADFLLLDDIQDYCRQFYLQHGNLSLSNCVCIDALARHHHLAEVSHVARKIIKSRFHDFLISSEELMEIPATCLLSLLCDADVTQFTSSEKIVRAVLKWVHHSNNLSREGHLLSMLETVDLQSLPLDCIRLLLTEPLIQDQRDLMQKLKVLDSNDDLSAPDEETAEFSEFAIPPSPGCNVEVQESSKPALIAVNCNPGFGYMKLLVYNVEASCWCNVPLNMELIMRAIPARLGVSSLTLHANTLYLFLSYNLPYPSDMLKIHILSMNLETEQFSLLSFRLLQNQNQCCQTTLTDDRSIPPVIVYCRGYLCVVGNREGTGQLYLCDMAAQTSVCYQVPGVRFISLARAVVVDERYIYIWCRHRFGHEEYCINKEVMFVKFDCKSKTFSASPLQAPPGISYGEFADPHMMCLEGRSVVIHSPGKASLVWVEAAGEWVTHHARLPSYPEQRTPVDLPYHGYEVYASCEDDVYVLQNPAAYTTNMVCLQSGTRAPLALTPPPVDCISLVTSGKLTPRILEQMPPCAYFDDTYTRLVHNRCTSVDCDTEGSGSPQTPNSDSDNEYEYDGYVYDDDIYGYYEDYYQ